MSEPNAPEQPKVNYSELDHKLLRRGGNNEMSDYYSSDFPVSKRESDEFTPDEDLALSWLDRERTSILHKIRRLEDESEDMVMEDYVEGQNPLDAITSGLYSEASMFRLNQERINGIVSYDDSTATEEEKSKHRKKVDFYAEREKEFREKEKATKSGEIE